MAQKSLKTKMRTRTSVATLVGVSLLTASAAAAAFGFASMSFSSVKPAPRALIISTSPTTPSSDIVIGGSTDVEIARYTFKANTEAVLVDRFTIDNCIAARDFDGDCADVNETSESLSAVRSLTASYQDSTGATIMNTVLPTGDTALFAGQTFYIPARSTRTLVVYANLNTVDDVSTFSGMRVQANLNAATEAFRAITATTTRTLTETFIARSFMANPMTLRNTRPTFSLSSASPSGAAPGDAEAFRFDVTANSSAPVELNRIVVKVESTDIDATGWNWCAAMDATDRYQLWHKTGIDSWEYTALTPTNYFATDGMKCGASSGTNVGYIEYTSAEEIEAGTAETYKILVEPIGDDTRVASGDTLRLSLITEAEANAIRGATLDAVTWNDSSTLGESVDARYIDNLPVTGNTLIY